jgi:phosphoribosylformylglycinamidine cyclo-ligase
MSEAYAAAGVDLNASNQLSDLLYEAAKRTWVNREGKFGEIRAAHDSFHATRSWGLEPLLAAPEPEKIEFNLDADGIGTKVEISQREATYNTAGFDLLAMGADDPAAHGFEPVTATTVLAVNSLREQFRPDLEQLAEGMVAAAAQAGVAIKGGETAVMGRKIGGYGSLKRHLHYDWSATVFSVAHRDRMITGNEIRPGDSLIALRESGFRSNGLSLVRRALRKEFGIRWHRRSFDGLEQKLGRTVLQPAVIYSGTLVDMIGGYDLRRQPKAEVHGVAHITGGGIPEKVGRMLAASGYGAEISEPFEPSETMKLVQRIEDVDDEEIYHIINMGQGLIIASSQPKHVRSVAASHGIESKEVGVVTQLPGIRLRSAGVKTPGKLLEFAA